MASALDLVLADRLSHIETVLSTEHAELRTALRVKLAQLEASGELASNKHAPMIQVDSGGEIANVDGGNNQDTCSKLKDSSSEPKEANESLEFTELRPYGLQDDLSCQPGAEAWPSPEIPPMTLELPSVCDEVDDLQPMSVVPAAHQTPAKENWSMRPNRSSLLSINSDTRCEFKVREIYVAAAAKKPIMKQLSKQGSSMSLEMSQVYTDTEGSAPAHEPHEVGWLPSIPLVPDSLISTSWEVLCMALILYDFVTMPLQFLYTDRQRFETPMDSISRVVWTVNIALRFIMGQIDGNGKPEARLRQVAARYLSSWLAFDIIMVAVDWFAFAFMDSGVQAFQTLRIMRLLRLMRIVRIAELLTLLNSYLALHVQSDNMTIVFKVAKILVQAWSISHLAACGWFGVSALDEQRNWPKTLNVSGVSVWYRYITSLHWALAQLSGSSIIDPENMYERTYASFTQFAFYAFSAIMISDLTTAMTQLQLQSAHSKKAKNILKRFLHDYKVPTRLAARVMDSAAAAAERTTLHIPENMVELLHQISGPLMMELHYHMHAPHLVHHPFFCCYSTLNPAGMRNICHSAIAVETLSAGDVIFSVGEISTEPRVYFDVKGSLNYVSLRDREHGSDARILEEGCVCNEAVLWIDGWQQLGALKTLQVTNLVSVKVHECLEAMLKFKTKNFYPALYARQFVFELNSSDPNHISDISSDFINFAGIADSVFGKNAEHYTHSRGGRRASGMMLGGRQTFIVTGLT